MEHFVDHPANLGRVVVLNSAVQLAQAKRFDSSLLSTRLPDGAASLSDLDFGHGTLLFLMAISALEDANCYPSNTRLTEIPRRLATSAGSWRL